MPEKKSASSAYARSGVDVAKADHLLDRVKPALARATRPESLGAIGGFGGFFDISRLGLRHPVLVSSTDSVGTKVTAARLCGHYRHLGADIVNHCANDIAVCGAEPLYFLDYYATGVLNTTYVTLMKGLAKACTEGNIALVGGETAELPGVYAKGECDLVGTIVGAVEKSAILTGEAVRPGDQLLGLASSGLHTNGYSLARRILFRELRLDPRDPLPGQKTRTDTALLKPHLNYSPFLQKTFAAVNEGPRASARKGNAVFAAAHITGGGFTGNLSRVLPGNCSALIDTNSWNPLPIFKVMVESGEVGKEEAYEVFNMGIGLVLIVARDAVKEVSQLARSCGHRPSVIGEVTRGNGSVGLSF
ncbi:MAG: phosphoribosylformylglycinamidine cyclo-ligase [Verrucomicrobia bacterium]|jgi:phosphoribosylformylglycinamidine cyclo-ligase|nr:phosphoribosylformylglycinamidine cyclo-ligase [Verrucomicrobiota bacterium]